MTASTRGASLSVNVEPGSRLDPLRREFLRYVPSAEGRGAVLKDGSLPVPAPSARRALESVGIANPRARRRDRLCGFLRGCHPTGTERPGRPAAAEALRRACAMTVNGEPEANESRPAIDCVVVEDHLMFLELLTGLLAARPGLRVIATARSVAEGTAVCLLRRPELLLLDLALPDGDGLDVARQFLTARPDGRVIVLSGHSDAFVCPDWLTSRLAAVISKNDTFDALRRELDELLGLLPAATTDDRATGDNERLLTAREMNVYSLIGEGLSTAQIADRLRITRNTVQTLRKRIASKLGTQGNELTRRAVAHRAMLSNRTP
jgi:DNA-binding NarL/FixJ family response regulator